MAAVPQLQLGKFRYLVRGAKPTPSTEAYLLPSLSEFGDIVTLPLTDLRPSLDLGEHSPYNLQVHGFTARRHPSALHSAPYNRASWNNEKLLREVYFPEVVEFVQNLTGCKKAVVSAAVVRNRLYSESEGSSAAEAEADAQPEVQDDTSHLFPPIFGNSIRDGVCPAPKVHLDCTPKGARHHIRRYHSEVALAAEDVIVAENRLLESGIPWNDLKNRYRGDKHGERKIPHFALFSIWRPLKTVHRDPLAISSAASFPVSDYVPSDQREPTDHSIPAHLYHIISNSDVQDAKGPDMSDDTYQTQSYLAYAPQDEDKVSHDWHYISEQQPSDVLVIQLFDNEMEAHARAPLEGGRGKSDLGVGGAVHSAFELVDQDEKAEARESIEVRVAAFW